MSITAFSEFGVLLVSYQNRGLLGKLKFAIAVKVRMVLGTPGLCSFHFESAFSVTGFRAQVPRSPGLGLAHCGISWPQHPVDVQ